MRNRLTIIGCMLAIGMIVGLTSCQDEMLSKENFRASGVADLERGELFTFDIVAGTASTPVSDGGITPYIIPGANRGGNRTCEEVAYAFDVDAFVFSVGQYDFDDGQFQIDWSDYGFTEVTVTGGTYLSFVFDDLPDALKPDPSKHYCVGAVIVKGGPTANVYFYEDGIKEDDGLASPVVVPPARGRGAAAGPANPAGLSNLTFCFVECEVPDEPLGECKEETAYAGNTLGDGAAWWYYFDTQGPTTQDIFAGSPPDNKVEGASVTYDQGVGTLTITLGPNMSLQDVDQPVKIQGYDAIPDSRPSSGLFTTYKGNLLTINNVPHFKYFVIHLDAIVCRESEI